MKALTVRQPWAWAIIHAGKNIENRSRKTNFRGRFLIHAGLMVPGWQPLADLETRHSPYPDPELLTYGAVIGSAVLAGCEWSNSSVGKWGEPMCWHWQIEMPQMYTTPIPAKGALGFWEFKS